MEPMWQQKQLIKDFCIDCGKLAEEKHHLHRLDEAKDPWMTIPLCKKCHLKRHNAPKAMAHYYNAVADRAFRIAMEKE